MNQTSCIFHSASQSWQLPSAAAAPKPHHGWCGDCFTEVITISDLDNNHSPTRVHSLTITDHVSTWNISVLTFPNRSFWSKQGHESILKLQQFSQFDPNIERGVCPLLSKINLHKFCQVILTCAFHSCLEIQGDDIKSISTGNWRRLCPERRTTFINTFPDCSPQALAQFWTTDLHPRGTWNLF